MRTGPCGATFAVLAGRRSHPEFDNVATRPLFPFRRLLSVTVGGIDEVNG